MPDHWLRSTCLFPDEAEVARLIMGPKRAKTWPERALILERQGLPPIDPLLGGRYWPAVRDFFDRRQGLKGAEIAGYALDGPEDWS